MRNDNSAAAGAPTDDGTNGVYASAVPRRTRRRKQILAGIVGLTAILGAGAYAVTYQLTDGSRTTDAGALPPARIAAVPGPGDSSTPAGTVAPSKGPSGATQGSSSAAAQSGQTAAGGQPKTLAERVADARNANKRLGTEVRKPLAPGVHAAAIPDSEVTVTESGVLATDRHTLKVVSAKGDLTGQRELALVGDKGKAVGSARCTNKIRFSAGAPATAKPTFLLCWRTSASRSVYTLAVDLAGKPSAQASVAEIDKTWAKLS